MNETMQPFLDDGLSVYAKAKATLTFFEAEIGKLLSKAVERRGQWPYLESHKLSPPEPGGGDSGDYWIVMFVEGSSHRKEQVKIECGIWWNAVDDNGNPIVFGCFHGPENIITVPSWEKQEQGIASFNRWGRKHLYLPITKSTNIRDSLNQVLDELLKQLK
jgi:hypothetical protein